MEMTRDERSALNFDNFLRKPECPLIEKANKMSGRLTKEFKDVELTMKVDFVFGGWASDFISFEFHSYRAAQKYALQHFGRADYFAGMEIHYYPEDGIYEVLETNAGKDENELHIFKRTKSARIAYKNFMRGNKRSKSRIEEIYH